MKYEILIAKEDDGTYSACCPVLGGDVKACGRNADEALSCLRSYLLCFLHDPQAELVASTDKKKDISDTTIKEDAISVFQ